jgi:hypothetical protein
VDTFFAAAGRASEEELNKEIEIISNNPVVDGLLTSVSGLLAVLNNHRQVIAVNESFMQMLGINDPEKSLGLRPGEALKCIHCDEGPDGCGTSKYCATCGSAVAIVSSLAEECPVEKICSVSADKDGEHKDIVLEVKSHPVKLNGEVFILLFMQDITTQHQRAALERVFFHDMSNFLSGLFGSCELLKDGSQNPDLIDIIYNAALRLHKEFEIQKCMATNNWDKYVPFKEETDEGQILKEIDELFVYHHVSGKKNFETNATQPDLKFTTDVSLLLRVVSNMITNAFEATEAGGTVSFNLKM